MPFNAARNFNPECALASSIARRVSFVNLQKFTLAPCDDPRSIMMFAPAQKIRSLSDVASSESIPAARPPSLKGPRRPKRPRNADPLASTRVDILKSAAKAFRRLGYHGATVEQIAAALHMKKGNLYYYFKNKEEILFACHQYSLDQLMRLLDEVERSGIAADEKLRRLIVAFVHTILDDLHGTALILELEA